MKTYLRLFAILSGLFLASAETTNAQAPAWSWAKVAGGTSVDYATGAASDASGNVYTTGLFSSPTIDFGTGPLANTGIENFYIAKYDAGGNVLWARVGGGTNADISWAIATDPSNNVLICGSFTSDSMDLGTGALLNASAGNKDIFLAKYDSSGTVLWAKRIGGSMEDSPTCIATDQAGNFYVGGFFRSDSLTIDTITVPSVTLPTSFLAKFDSGGHAIWVRTIGGYSAATGIAVDGSGNSTWGGNFTDATVTIDTFNLTNTDGVGFTDDMYLARYTPSGNILWAKKSGGTDQDYLLGLSVDLAGNSFVTGYFFSDSITFDAITKPNVSGGGSDDYYFARYDVNGNAQWAQGIPERYAEGLAVKADAFGNVFVAGDFGDTTATFGNTVLHLDTSASTLNALFLAKYSASGHALWAKSMSVTNYAGVYGLTTDAGGNIFMAGDFSSPTLPFDSLLLTNTASNGSSDIFISKIGIPCHAYYTILPDTAPHTWIAVDYATGAAPLTYSWNWGDGNTSPGATPSHTYAVAGNYNICQTITDANSCTDTYCDSSLYLNRTSASATMVYIYVVGSMPSGLIDPGSAENTLAVYPNPSSNHVMISGGGLNSSYTLTDMTGKLLASGTLTESFYVLDISKLVKGIYFLTVTGKNERITKKIVKD